jgi:hypothetical protein
VGLAVTAQAAFPTGGGNGGSLILNGGAGDGAGANGNVRLATTRGLVDLGPTGTASGGGATLPIFTVGIGQAGQPTTAAQWGWKKILDGDNSTVEWIPVWR